MKKIYSDWHKTFPGSGQGKEYPYLLDKILTHNKEASKTRSGQQAWHAILDYGCGKGGTALWLQSLIKKQPLAIDLYDPGHELYKHTPLREKYDLVYSCDVLEHIEREDLDATIEHTQALSGHNIHIIDMTPAKKHLPDGRNAHVTLMNTHEWIELFEQHDHTIEEVFPYAVPDPNFTTRERVCIWTRRLKEYTRL